MLRSETQERSQSRICKEFVRQLQTRIPSRYEWMLLLQKVRGMQTFYERWHCVYRLFWCSWDQMSAIILSRRWSCLSIILYNVFHIDANALLWKDSTIANAYRYKEFWRTFVLSQFLTGVCTFYSTYINPHPFSETFKSIYDDKRLIHCCHQAHLHNHLQ